MRKYGYEYSNMRTVEKWYNLANDGPFVVYEQKPGWKYRRLRHDCVLYKLMQEVSEIVGYKCTDLIYWLDPLYSNDEEYVVQISVKTGTKKMEALLTLGFN